MNSNMATDFQMASGPNGLSYFNGTCCPVVSGDFIDYKAKADKLLVNMLKGGETLSSIGKGIYEQMEMMEKTLSDICAGKPTTNKKIKRWCQVVGLDHGGIHIIWYMNVYILLKLKLIKNDEMNGMLYHQYLCKEPEKSPEVGDDVLSMSRAVLNME